MWIGKYFLVFFWSLLHRLRGSDSWAVDFLRKEETFSPKRQYLFAN